MSPEQIKSRLVSFFPDGQIEVVDLTGGGDHWEVFVASQAFQGLSRIEQHQKVMAAFEHELKTGDVHALSIRTQLKPIIKE